MVTFAFSARHHRQNNRDVAQHEIVGVFAPRALSAAKDKGIEEKTLANILDLALRGINKSGALEPNGERQ